MLDKILSFIAVRLKNLSTVTKTQSFTFNGKTFMFRKIGAIVYLDAASDIQGWPQGATQIGILDEELRPYYVQRYRPQNDSSGYNRFLQITTDGKVILYNSSAFTGAGNNSFAGFCYITRGGIIKAVISTFSALSGRRWEHVRQNTGLYSRQIIDQDWFIHIRRRCDREYIAGTYRAGGQCCVTPTEHRDRSNSWDRRIFSRDNQRSRQAQETRQNSVHVRSKHVHQRRNDLCDINHIGTINNYPKDRNTQNISWEYYLYSIKESVLKSLISTFSHLKRGCLEC